MLEKILNSKQPPPIEQYMLDYDSFTKFFWKYRWLIKERERNNAFWASTNENLKISYEKLDEQERELARAYSLNQKYLDNIKEGLLLINTDYIIQDQYSKYLVKLLGTDNIAGKNIIDLFYPDPKEQNDERQELGKFLNMLFSNILAEFEMILSVNPLRNKILKIVQSNGVEKELIINVDFIRIYGDKDNITNVMLIFEDKTDLVKVQHEVEYEKGLYQAEVESISAIFKAGPDILKEFLFDINNVLHDFQDNKNKLKRKKIVDHLFRQVHSLKGSAKYLELNHIAEISHEIENNLAQLKGDRVHFRHSIINEINLYLKRLQVELKNMDSLVDKVEKFSEKIMQTKNASNDVLLENFLTSLNEMVHKISDELDKDIIFKINNSVTTIPFLKEIKNSIIHLIRNSIDHGIEDKYQRLISQKPMEGTIRIHMKEENGHIVIQIEDDGGGINYQQVKEKAILLGIVKKDEDISRSKLLNIIFNASFSSKDSVDSLSGRGFGLNIVKDEIGKLNGKIAVSTKEGQGTKFILRIPK